MDNNVYEIMNRIKERNNLIKEPSIKIIPKNNSLKKASIILSIFSLFLGFLIYAKKDENANFLKENFGIEVNFSKINKTCEKFIDKFLTFEYDFIKNKDESLVSLNDSYIELGDNKFYNSSLKVYSIDDGIVTNVNSNEIVIEHDNGIIAKYSNIVNPYVFKFDRINEYQTIALFNEYLYLLFYKDGNLISYEEIYN